MLRLFNHLNKPLTIKLAFQLIIYFGVVDLKVKMNSEL